jgi:tetratricopeptide (TPR) repeat protein
MTLWFSGSLLSNTCQAESLEEATRLLRSGDEEAAMAAARTVVEADLTEIGAHEIIIDILMNRGLGVIAESAYSEMAATNPSQAWAWTLYGRASTSAESAASAYQQALQVDPHYSRAWAGQADIYRALGETDSARAGYERAIDLEPENGPAYIGLATLLLSNDASSEALEVCQSSMALAPTYPDCYLLSADLLPSSAVHYLERGVGFAPNDPRLYAALGDALMRAGRFDDAAHAIGAALDINPIMHAALWNRMVITELRNETIDVDAWQQLTRAKILQASAPLAAVDLLTQLSEGHPNSPLICLAFGNQLASSRSLAEAERELVRGLRLELENVDINASLGLLYQSQSRHSEALPLLRLAATARPDDLSLQLAHGITTANVEGPRPAAIILAQAAQRYPSDPRAAMALATLLSQNGDKRSAVTVLERAVGAYPEPDLLLALAAAYRDVDENILAAGTLRRLAEYTGDDTWLDAANSLESSAN